MFYKAPLIIVCISVQMPQGILSRLNLSTGIIGIFNGRSGWLLLFNQMVIGIISKAPSSSDWVDYHHQIIVGIV
ncbi:hypothetical protein D3C77_615280 [compost metagenome]